jgi:hypothetical protein
MSKKDNQEIQYAMVQIQKNNDEDLVRQIQIDGKWKTIPTDIPVKVPLYIAEKLLECNYISKFTLVD